MGHNEVSVIYLFRYDGLLFVGYAYIMFYNIYYIYPCRYISIFKNIPYIYYLKKIYIVTKSAVIELYVIGLWTEGIIFTLVSPY